jgi:Reverse transcriptase (RNA-dependent DNA polymerase)
VARGFSQVIGVDYNDTFAPTVRMETLRLFFAMVARKNLECSHFDIKNAFTESHLKEKILMDPPPGLKVKKGMVLKVLRSLYGLKQAARD